SSFGSRQVIYERFFFGDPVRMQMATFGSYDRQPYMNRVREFLAREDGATQPGLVKAEPVRGGSDPSTQ
ncbi:MAG: 4-hydroxyphenylacetate 3-hydroxylase C-terminal domain-containing protein, partial [bacterium]